MRIGFSEGVLLLLAWAKRQRSEFSLRFHQFDLKQMPSDCLKALVCPPDLAELAFLDCKLAETQAQEIVPLCKNLRRPVCVRR